MSGEIPNTAPTLPAPAAPRCAFCGTSLFPEYWLLGEKAACGGCRQQVLGLDAAGRGLAPLLRAALFGIGAGILGGVAYAAISNFTGYEIGILAAFVGIFVGRAVRKGSGNVGGRRFQALGAVLAYLAVVSTYAPPLWKALQQSKVLKQASVTSGATAGSATPAPADSAATSATPRSEREPPIRDPLLRRAVGFTLFGLLVLAAPFLAGFQNVIGWLILGFAVWEAWRVNRGIATVIRGPFRTGDGAVATVTAPPPIAPGG